MNWIIEAAMEADPREDRVVLEDPTTVAALDEILLKKYVPFIRSELEKTGYPITLRISALPLSLPPLSGLDLRAGSPSCSSTKVTSSSFAAT